MRFAVWRFARIVAGTMALCLCVEGCQPVYNTTPLDTIKVENFDPTASVYRIGIGDELELKYMFAPELNDRMQVRPDGRISVMFAQDVQAAGKTPEELTEDLKHALAPHVKQLDMVVEVRSFGSQKVFVGGEVIKPGPIVLAAPESVLQLLTEVGWMTPYAGPEKVILLRRDQQWREHLYKIDTAQIMNGKDMSQNVMIQAGDIVLVAPSDAVITDRWVDQYIRQAIPFSTTAGAYYTYNPMMR